MNKKLLYLLSALTLCAICTVVHAGETADSTCTYRRGPVRVQGTVARKDSLLNVSKMSWYPFEMGWLFWTSTDYSLYQGTTYTDEFMTLNTAKSIMMNIDLIGVQYALNKKESVTFSFDLSLNVNNYVFDRHIRLQEDPADGKAIPTAIGTGYDKTKLTTAYLTVPLFLYFKPKQRLIASVGLIPGLKLNEHAKIKKPKEKEKLETVNDFKLAAEMRFQFFSGCYMFGMYDLLPLFKDDRGPKIRQAALGVGIRIAD